MCSESLPCVCVSSENIEMDGTKLTPTKILRLMNLAESRTPNYCLPRVNNQKNQCDNEHGSPSESHKLRKDNSESLYSGESYVEKSTNHNFGSSLGILDVDSFDTYLGFDERPTQSFSTDKMQPDSSAHSICFNTREISGRSTEGLDKAGLQNDVQQLAVRLREQSSSVAAVIRDSIATDTFSVHNGDMTEEELMFIKDSSAIPLSDLNMDLTRTMDKKWNECSIKSESMDMSVGTYFNKGSIKMEHIIGRSESPKYDASAYLGPVLQEGDSRTYSEKAGFSTINDTAASDMALDCVPVKETGHDKQPASLRNPYVEHLKQPASLMAGEESSIADASLSISLIAKCLGNMDLASTPSFLMAEANRKKDTEKVNNITQTISSSVAKGQTIVPFRGKELDRTQNKTFKMVDDPKPKIPPTPYRNSSKNTFIMDDKKRNSNSMQNYSNARSNIILDDNSHRNNKVGTFVSTLASVGKTNTGSSVATVDTVISKPVITVTISDDESDKENVSINNRISPNVRNSNSDRDEVSFTPHANSTVSDSCKNKVSSVRDVSPRRCGNSNMFTTQTASSYKTHSLTQSSSEANRKEDTEKVNNITQTISSSVAKGQTIVPFRGKELDRTQNKTFKMVNDPKPKIPPTPYRNSSKNTFIMDDKKRNSNSMQNYSNASSNIILDDNSHRNNKVGRFVSTLASVGKTNTGSSVATVDTVISKPVITVTISDDESDKENVSINNRISPNVRNSNSDRDEVSFTPHANSTVSDSCKNKVSSVRDVSPRRCGNSNMFTTQTASSYKTHSLTQSSSGDDKTKDVENFSTEYRELEKSVNWREILPIDSQEKDSWIRLEVEPLVAYIGISSVLKISITSLTNLWLSLRLELDKTMTDCGAFSLETCRAPIPLRPKATETCSLAITATAELKSPISLIAIMQDTCSDRETFVKKQLNITFLTPDLKLYTTEGLRESLEFPPIQENRNVCMPIVIKSDCPADLQLIMSMKSGENCFSIAGVKIIEDSEMCLDGDYRLVNSNGVKSGRLNKHYRTANFTRRVRCIIPHGAALQVIMTCNAPALVQLKQQNNLAQLNGCVSIHTIVGNVLVKEIKMSASVGIVRLLSKNTEPFQISKGENYKVDLCNAGSIESSWRVCTRNTPTGDESMYFKATPDKVTLGPGQQGQVEVMYTGPNDGQSGVLVLENTTDGSDVAWQLCNVSSSRETFPVRTTHSEMCWARPDVVRDVRLKNTGQRRVSIRANVRGEGFHILNTKELSVTFNGLTIDSGTRHDGGFSFSLSAGECKELRVNFNPVKSGAHAAKLILCSATQPGLTKSVRLFGCGSCGSAVRWGRGVVRAPGGPALLPAPRDGRVLATLANRGRAAAFVAATLTFNWQFSSVSAGACLTGSHVLMLPGAMATLGVNLDARRLQVAATSALHATAHHLATLSVLTGDDSTRRRILRIIQKDPDAAHSIPGAEEQLKRLADKFHNEDAAVVNLDGLNETKRSLPTLLSELEELTAHITISKEALEDQTILPGDESSVHYHTLCDDNTLM